MVKPERSFDLRLRAERIRWGAAVACHLLGFVLLLAVPARLRLGGPFWQLEGATQAQVWVWGAVFLVNVLVLVVASRRERGIGAPAVLTTGLLVWGAGYGFLAAQSTLSHSRAIAAASIALGWVLVIAPLLLSRWRPLPWLMTAATVLVAAWIGREALAARTSPDAPTTERLRTHLHPLEITRVPALLPPQPNDGGAIERYGDQLLLLTATGQFWRLQEDRESTSGWRVERLPLDVPLGRERFLADQREPRKISVFRATDFVLDTTTAPPTVYAAHQHWSSEGRCYTVRVSVSQLPAAAPAGAAASAPASAPAWRTLYESSPCIEATERFDEFETGGRLAWLDPRTLLLTVGDHGISGQGEGDPILPQDSTSAYGKTIRLGVDGTSAIFTRGHRNPQGLAIDDRARVWITEHGPRGGDEVNLLRAGSNYGWPLVTYGTQYGLDYWTLNPTGRDHGDFVEPAYTFIPSIGISNLIQVRDTLFSRWRGDLLVASLLGRRLVRLRLRDDRVVYAEQIRMEANARDLVEAPDGRIVIYDGNQGLMVIALAEPTEGERAYAPCVSCHGVEARGTASGPSLQYLFDRPIGVWPGWEYSPALRALGGTWNEERLDAFLRDPAGYVPGTTMRAPGIADPAARRAIIEYLRTRP